MQLFGSSGIREKYGSLVNPTLAMTLGKSLGSLNYRSVVVGRDTRLSGETLLHGLLAGLLASGCEVTDLGILPTPLVCFATRHFGKDCGVMITASHNPGEYNGFKLWKANGAAFSPQDEARVEEKVLGESLPWQPWDGLGSRGNSKNAVSPFGEALATNLPLKGNMRVLVDAGNGAAFQVCPQLLRQFGYDVVEVNCTADGSFPQRQPEPTAKTLARTAQLVVSERCQLGFCHDGDADRVVVIDDQGRVVDFDKFLVFLSRHLVDSTGINRVVTTVDASMLIDNILSEVEIIRTRVGDVFVAHALQDEASAFGGEPCGAYIFPQHGLWPDGVYSVFKILHIMENQSEPLSKLLEGLPSYPMSREKFPCPSEHKQAVMECIRERLPETGSLNTTDGVRADYGSHVVLIRPSGTEGLIRCNLEARSPDLIDEKRPYFSELIRQAIKDSLNSLHPA